MVASCTEHASCRFPDATLRAVARPESICVSTYTHVITSEKLTWTRTAGTAGTTGIATHTAHPARRGGEPGVPGG